MEGGSLTLQRHRQSGNLNWTDGRTKWCTHRGVDARDAIVTHLKHGCMYLSRHVDISHPVEQVLFKTEKCWIICWTKYYLRIEFWSSKFQSFIGWLVKLRNICINCGYFFTIIKDETPCYSRMACCYDNTIVEGGGGDDGLECLLHRTSNGRTDHKHSLLVVCRSALKNRELPKRGIFLDAQISAKYYMRGTNASKTLKIFAFPRGGIWSSDECQDFLVDLILCTERLTFSDNEPPKVTTFPQKSDHSHSIR